jgi:hypothetical protein
MIQATVARRSAATSRPGGCASRLGSPSERKFGVAGVKAGVFRPRPGAPFLVRRTHSLRCGLLSFAPTELETAPSWSPRLCHTHGRDSRRTHGSMAQQIKIVGAADHDGVTARRHPGLHVCATRPRGFPAFGGQRKDRDRSLLSRRRRERPSSRERPQNTQSEPEVTALFASVPKSVSLV